MMDGFLFYILKSSFCVGLFLIIYMLFLRKTTFFRFNRAFLLCGLVVSLIVPAINMSYDVVVPLLSANLEAKNNQVQDVLYQTFEIDWRMFLLLIYAVGVVLLLGRNFYFYKLFVKLTNGGKMTKNADYKLVDNPQVKSPFTVFNFILLNTSLLSAKELELIIQHEKTHIAQKHWVDLLLSECMLALQWFNPLCWLYVRMQKENHEFLADKAVLDSGASRATYQAVLINQRFEGPVFSFANSFNYPNQLNRLIMMKKTKTTPWKRCAALAVAPLLGVFIWASATPNYVYEEVQVFDNVKSNQLNSQKPLLIIAGEEYPDVDASLIDEKYIESITVLTGKDATKQYGSKGKNGVTIIELKKGYDYSMLKGEPMNFGDDNLYIIDEKEVSQKEMNALDVNKIKAVSVLKGKSATDIYGEKGKNGVIIITTK